ncbi:hypothetical protein [Arthrobacter sp. HLT1-21]
MKPIQKAKVTRTRKCPVCGSESWRIAYGMILPDARELMPKTVFAGCCVFMDERLNLQTGERELGSPDWECQNAECRHQWW